MKKILANDGIDAAGKQILEKAGFTVLTEKVAQENLVSFINSNAIDGLTVRSATQVRKDIVDTCPNLKVIGRGGVGMDNIDVDYARSKGIKVENTPAASSHSVAELVFAHLYGMVRFMHDANRNMPSKGNVQFDTLKKSYAKGIELKEKTIGIIGFGRIGQAVAKIALGNGMKVIAHDPFIKSAKLNLDIQGLSSPVEIEINTISFDEVITTADFITLHVPGGNVIGSSEIAKMKNGVMLLNASRGGVINEEALIEALNSGKIAAAGLDVFNNEPKPSEALLSHPKTSLTPHIGASTNEAQERIGIELAEKLIEALK